MDNELTTHYDIRSTDTAQLTVDYAWNIGKALADWLPTDGRVIISGHATQERLTGALAEGVRLQGRSVVHGQELSKEQLSTLITSNHFSGGILVGYDELQQTALIEIYQHQGHLVTSETGLLELTNLADSGNFVPAAVKGELTELV